MAYRPEDDFQAAFWQLKRAMTAALEDVLRRHGVHPGQQFVLQCLWDEDGLSPGEVARRLGLATPTVTRTAQRLEHAGFLTRTKHESDSRLVRLQLTASGRDVREAVERDLTGISDRAFDGLGDRQRRQAVSLLRRIRTNLEPRQEH